jgi:ceramide glucosyltransferase
MSWATVWRHQLRWARTIRVSQPAPYFFSILSNITVWTLAWMAIWPHAWSLGIGAMVLAWRALIALKLQARLAQRPPDWAWFWVPWVKDLMQLGIWAVSFMGNTVEWRGERMRLARDGTLQPLGK